MSLNNLNMHCISIDANDLKLIKELNYVPVGLGGSDFTDEWIKDNRGINIAEKIEKEFSKKFIFCGVPMSISSLSFNDMTFELFCVIYFMLRNN